MLVVLLLSLQQVHYCVMRGRWILREVLFEIIEKQALRILEELVALAPATTP
eukprot:c25967_g1_i1 orf=169-324(+)